MTHEMEKTRSDIHVLMVAFSAQGHLNPMHLLGQRLVAEGLRVTLATTELGRESILQSPAIHSGVHFEFYSDGFDINADRKANFNLYIETLAKVGPVNLSKIIESYNNKNKISSVIGNPFVPWVVDVAAQHGIPCAMVWIQPCTLFSIYYHFFNNLNPFPISMNPNMAPLEFPGLSASVCMEDLPSFIHPSNDFDSIQKLVCKFFEDIKKVKWVLGNSFCELEKEVVNSMNEICPIRPIGPLVPPELLIDEHQDRSLGIDLWKSEDECIEWLDLQPPSSVIYISFGSLIVLKENEMMNISKALKNTKIRFLWVIKQETRPSTDGGKGKLLQVSLPEELKNQGLVVKWSPQTKVLSHPSVGCFLSHCGWNSMLESIAVGMPIIAYPHWSDQPMNAMIAEKVLGIGVRLRRNKDGVAGNEEIEKCVEEVMFGPRSDDYRKKAAALKEAARKAVAVNGSSDQNIQSFVDEITAAINCF